jgi:hypothetical protein
MSVEEVLDSVRRIITRWTVTNTPLTANASAGDTVLTVNASKRFREIDEVLIRNSVSAETPLIVESIIDDTHIKLSTPIRFNWNVSDNAILEKTFHQNFVQNVYLGEPENIPKFPAITISAESSSSEWITLRSTKETYNIKISIYVQKNIQEDTYRYHLQLANTIQWGLKHNIFPLVGPYTVTAITSDISSGDLVIKVADSSIFDPTTKHRVLIEDLYKSEDLIVTQILDPTTVVVSRPICFDYLVSNGAKAISVSRFIYNSWPNNIQFGTIFKGTLLKAATIDWFAWEEEVQRHAPMDTSLT